MSRRVKSSRKTFQRIHLRKHARTTQRPFRKRPTWRESKALWVGVGISTVIHGFDAIHIGSRRDRPAKRLQRWTAARVRQFLRTYAAHYVAERFAAFLGTPGDSFRSKTYHPRVLGMPSAFFAARVRGFKETRCSQYAFSRDQRAARRCNQR